MIELSDPTRSDGVGSEQDAATQLSPGMSLTGPWREFQGLLKVIDLFKDGSLYIVDAPGHLPGHINLLAQTQKNNGSTSWTYLAGDACHNRRIMRKEREISEWIDIHGQTCCIHADRAKAEETIERIRVLERWGVEVILAHDTEWEHNGKNTKRFFGTSGTRQGE